jgi:UDP-2-acetamido-2,6-beta-L-arabino-hexul-4-ose reductase
LKKRTICITGQNGFIGYHLYNTLKLFPDKYILKEFDDKLFENTDKLESCLSDCDVIVHLAAVNRHKNPRFLYDTNLNLTRKVIDAVEKLKINPQIIISSSTQESTDNIYGKSKKESRKLFIEFKNIQNIPFVGLIIPNVFGPFCKPNYNSFISTFSSQLINGISPQIIQDNNVDLIYISDLILQILNIIDLRIDNEKFIFKNTSNYKVLTILKKLKKFKSQYLSNGVIPDLQSNFDRDLFNTFRSFINHKNFFPKLYLNNSDERGSFVELARLETGGQLSFSTTKPGITRGNHFHTRKIERFSVIKGKALIQIRKIGTEEIIEFYLDGENPAYVDMPVWYTHNIINYSNEEVLYTNFWINEPYDPKNSDTYFIEV